MTRRVPRRLQGGRPSAVTTGEAALAAMLPDFDYRMDRVTLSGANLATVPNQGTAGGTLTPTTTVAGPSSDAAARGEMSIAISNLALQSSLAASAYAAFHNGAGCHSFCVWVPTNAASRSVWATRSFAGTEVGSGFFYQASQSCNFQTANGTANLYLHASAASALPVNAVHSLESSFLDGGTSPEAATFRDGGTPVNSGDVAGTPSAAAPTSTLRIGNSAGVTLVGEMRFLRWIGFTRRLSAAEVASVRALLTARYGA